MIRNIFSQITYRTWQFTHRLTAKITYEDLAPVRKYLTPGGQRLFLTMNRGDQQHSLNVFQKLQEQGCEDTELLAAALLHDSGKGAGRVPFLLRPAVVLMLKLLPGLLPALAGPYPSKNLPLYRRYFYYAWRHADIGADLALAAHEPDRVAALIRAHHDPNGPAAALHKVDDAL